MAEFDNMLDDVLDTVKRAVDVTGKKAGELVGMGKLKYQEHSLSRDVTKAYAKLGALAYQSKITGEDFSEAIENAVDELTRLNVELDTVTDDMAEAVGDFKKPVEKAEEKVKDVVVDIENAVDDLKDDLADTATDIKHEVTNVASSVSEEVDELADEIITKLSSDDE